MKTDSPAGLYLHVPFCSGKCPYCDFYSIPGLEHASGWVEAVIREAEHYAPRFNGFDTLYLGGGTPSRLPEEALVRLMSGLSDLGLEADAEKTIEINPEDAGPEKAGFWRALGFNRASLGAQSFSDTELAFLGRRHSLDQVEKAIFSLRRAGFANLGLDLIYGLPGRSVEDWGRSLARALAFEPEHLSCYQLTLEKETPMGRRVEAGSLEPLSEEAALELFLETRARLTGRGYVHYEVSNYAREDKFRSRHNQKYWRHQPYLGLGPAAHSFQGRRRWWNHKSVEAFIDSWAAGRPARVGFEDLDRAALDFEGLILGLRTSDGASLPQRRSAEAEAFLEDLSARNLAEVREGLIRLTGTGLAAADRLAVLLAEKLWEEGG